MEEEIVEEPKTIITWSQLLSLGILASLLYASVSDPTNLAAKGLLMLSVVVLWFLSTMSQVKVLRHSRELAIAACMQVRPTVDLINSLNPSTPYRLGSLFVMGAISYQFVNADQYMLAFIAMAPSISWYFVYNRIIQFIGRKDIQEYASERATQMAEDDAINQFIQDEINLVMPDIIKRAEAMFDKSLTVEEDENESREPDHEDH